MFKTLKRTSKIWPKSPNAIYTLELPPIDFDNDVFKIRTENSDQVTKILKKFRTS